MGVHSFEKQEHSRNVGSSQPLQLPLRLYVCFLILHEGSQRSKRHIECGKAAACSISGLACCGAIRVWATEALVVGLCPRESIREVTAS